MNGTCEAGKPTRCLFITMKSSVSIFNRALQSATAATAVLAGAWVLVAALLTLVADADATTSFIARFINHLFVFSNLEQMASLRGVEVSALLWEGGKKSLVLILGALALIAVIGCATGLAAAVWAESRITMAWTRAVHLLSSVPVLVWSFSLLFVFDVAHGRGGSAVIILPVVALAFGDSLMSGIVRAVRVEAAQVLQQDYIRAARARGVSIAPHLVRGVLPAAVTALTGLAAYLIGGAIVVEWVYSYRGLGYEIVTALTEPGFKNYPLVVAVTLLSVGVAVGAHLLRDVCALAVDPRLRQR